MNLDCIAKEIRIDVLKMFYKSQTGHLAPALSCVDILTVLYFGGIINDANFIGKDRSRIILSKGHACAALYACLARKGFFDRSELLTFYQKSSDLGGHPNINIPGIEVATGSLGHGICFATGVAKAGQIDGKKYNTYVIIGDGEMQEGSVWEAAMFAANQSLKNLIVIVDHNGLQAADYVADIAPIESIMDKWMAFGWNVVEVNGHNLVEIKKCLLSLEDSAKPTIVIAKTIKGKGISFIENNPMWHSRAPKGDEWNDICEEIGIDLQELSYL